MLRKVLLCISNNLHQGRGWNENSTSLRWSSPFCFYDVFLCFRICFFRCLYTFSCGDSAGGLNCVGNPLVRGFPRATWRAEPFMWWAEHIKYHECDITYRGHISPGVMKSRKSLKIDGVGDWEVESNFLFHGMRSWSSNGMDGVKERSNTSTSQDVFKGCSRVDLGWECSKNSAFLIYFWYILHIFYHWTVGGHLRWVAPHPAIFHANFSPCNILLPALKTQ